MKIKILSIFIVIVCLNASDEITIDSLFKKQKGLRSITSLEFIYSGSSKSFNIYPIINSYDDGRMIEQTKILSLRQTFLYALNDNIDVLGTISGKIQSKDIIQNSIKTENDNDINDIWIGIKYEFDKNFFDFKQSITAQIALYENRYFKEMKDSLSLKSINIRYSLFSYLDPVVLTLYFDTVQKIKNSFADYEIKFPDIYSFGLDTNIVLNPKLSLSLSITESLQTEMMENSVKVNPSTILSQIGFGLTYNLDSKNAFLLSTYTGTSNVSPDSRLIVSLWHKY